MNERYWEIDKYLKQYNDLFLDQNKVSIYNYLTTYNVLYDDLIDSSIKEIIDKLLSCYKGSFKCELKDYLIITNGEIKVNGIKLYVNSPRKDIFGVVDTILKYVLKENIIISLKVAQKVRADGIVINVNTKECATKLIDFINGDKYLKKVVKKGNPFLPRNGKVSFTYDEYINYNSFISQILDVYFDIKKKTNTREEVSIEDFRTFLHQYYLVNFETIGGIKDFSGEDYFCDNLSRIKSSNVVIDIETLILNFQKVCELLMNCCAPYVENKDIMMKIEEYQNNNNNEKFKFYKENLLDSIDFQDDLIGKQLLDSYILYAISKYGLRVTINQLDNFITKGDYQYITQDYSFRKRFIEFNLLDKINKFIDQDIHTYVYKINEKNYQLVSTKNISILLNDYILWGIHNYGYNNTLKRLNDFISEKNSIIAYNYITRKNNFRDMFIQCNMHININNIINNDINEYMSNKFNS